MRKLKNKRLRGQAESQTNFMCNMTHCYPLHDKTELDVLVKRWADFKNMTRWAVPGRWIRALVLLPAGGCSISQQRWSENILAIVALYFAWLQMYTRWLRFAAATGALTMLGNWMAEDGIDSNPLVLAYSIFLSLWSTLFNEAWIWAERATVSLGDRRV